MTAEREAWLEELLASRRAKDEYFRNDPDSPVPPNLRSVFRGLEYFPPDDRFAFSVSLIPSPSPRIIDLTTTKGPARRYEVSGYFEISVDGRDLRLWAFRSESPWLRDQLFLPFRDGTSGHETYGGGRYLDLEIPLDGIYPLDLNRSYHPYCAYNPSYACPLPPSENSLPVRVAAGERF
jgi:uncharacterized protein